VVQPVEADCSRVAPTHHGAPDRAQISAPALIPWGTPTVRLED